MIIKEPEKIAPEVLRSMLIALEYNRDLAYMQRLCYQLKTRLQGVFTEWTDDGNNIYGTLVLMFGDYGTSPRSGWFGSNRLKEAMIKAIDTYRKELEEEITNGTEES